MPPKTKAIRIARRTRGSSDAGKNKKKQGCKGSAGPDPATPQVIANSVFALTLKPVTGATVLCANSLNTTENGIFDDLHKCMEKISPGFRMTYPDGLSLSERMNILLEKIKKCIPGSCGFSVDSDKTGVFINIYRACPYPNYLPVMIAGPCFIKLKQEHPKLHDLFVRFMQAFIKSTLIDTWFDGIFTAGMDNIDNMVDEHYRDIDMDPECIENANFELNYYRKGLPHEYEVLLSRHKRSLTVEKILKQLKRIRKPNPIKKIIEQGCSLIQPNATMRSFCHPIDFDENNDVYLSFDAQASILWRADGILNDEYDSWVESEANEGGVQIPYSLFKITPNGRALDMAEFDKRTIWPQQLADFISNSNTIIKRYTKWKI